MQKVAINTLKKGEFFKLSETAKEVYSYQGYCRESKKYTGQAESDFCKYCYKKKGTLVVIGFEY